MVRESRAVALAVVLVATSACGGSSSSRATASPDVWAVVNGREIRRDAIEKYYRTRMNPQAKPADEEVLNAKLNILDEMISKEVLLERARALKLEPTDAEVADKLTENKRPFTEEQFQRQLSERGLTLEDYTQELRQELTIDKLINREVLSKVTVTEQDLTDYYTANRDRFNVTEPQYRLAQIVITSGTSQIRNRTNSDAATPADAQRKVQMIMDRLKGGADFADLAMDFSEDPQSAANGGDLGVVPESAMKQAPPTFRQTVAKMRPGDVNLLTAGPMSTILLLISHEMPGRRELSDPAVSEAVRTGVRNRREQLMRAAYLGTVRDDAKVTNLLAQQILAAQGRQAPPAGIMTPPAK